MNPREPTDAEAEARGGVVVLIGGPDEGPDVIPCPAVVDPDEAQVHVAYELNELEVAALAQGGTIWLTTWGMIPVHTHTVVTREGEQL